MIQQTAHKIIEVYIFLIFHHHIVFCFINYRTFSFHVCCSSLFKFLYWPSVPILTWHTNGNDCIQNSAQPILRKLTWIWRDVVEHVNFGMLILDVFLFLFLFLFLFFWINQVAFVKYLNFNSKAIWHIGWSAREQECQIDKCQFAIQAFKKTLAYPNLKVWVVMLLCI